MVLPSAVRIVSGTAAVMPHTPLTTPLPPSCSAHITGTGDGRLFFFDLLHSAAALGQMDAQHDGNAVTSICLVPSSTGGGVSSLATGAIDGSIHLWEVRGGGRRLEVRGGGR